MEASTEAHSTMEYLINFVDFSNTSMGRVSITCLFAFIEVLEGSMETVDVEEASAKASTKSIGPLALHMRFHGSFHILPGKLSW